MSRLLALALSIFLFMGFSMSRAAKLELIKEFDYGTVKGMALTSYNYHLSEGYVVAVLDESNNLRIITWKSSETTPLGTSSIRDTETATRLAIAKLTGRSFVTPIRDSDGNLQIILWAISGNGMNINRVSHLTGPEITEVTATEANGAALIAARRPNGQAFAVMAFLEDNALTLSDEVNFNNASNLALSKGVTNILARRNKDGNLRLTQILHSGAFSPYGGASNGGLEIQDVDVTAIIDVVAGRWVTISGNGSISKLIEWRKTNAAIPGEFERYAQLEIYPDIGSTTQAVVKSIPTGKLITGQIGAYGNCEDPIYSPHFCAWISLWDLNDDGFQLLRNQSVIGEFTQIETTEISKVSTFDSRFVVAFVEADGNLKITVWGVDG
ncbi:hypothetical protein PsW64_01552 [Pseudovibrio sp. W64]|uniref:hypothetical protein n=1 Tax=Pseudovibrio sp. W64 TaxID=1735583 RepID=UPI0007B2EF62|nr:hypothetical protein [Pseudovibrio sp. W64]KZK86299.1 hypothetical protein PsW64_01552 [Pseudovibrio sp. W64]